MGSRIFFYEALELWIEHVDEKGNIREVLKELGWKLTKSEIIPKEEPYNIPFELLASKMINLERSASGLN
ncbi:MAG: hypothetical protein LBS61_01050 [Endomicrobium sp.]|nr:hypothetical protein [Endomicrobium sp.]